MLVLAYHTTLFFQVPVFLVKYPAPVAVDESNITPPIRQTPPQKEPSFVETGKDSLETQVKILQEQVKVFKYDYGLKKKLHAELIEPVDQLEQLENEEMLLCEDLTLNNNNNNNFENIDEEFETNLRIVNRMRQQQQVAVAAAREDLPLVESIKLSGNVAIEKEIESDLRSLSSIEGSLQGILIVDDSANSKSSAVNDSQQQQQVCSSTPLIHLYPKIGKYIFLSILPLPFSII